MHQADTGSIFSIHRRAVVTALESGIIRNPIFGAGCCLRLKKSRYESFGECLDDSHDLILSETTMSVGIHGIATSTGSDVFDVAQPKRPSTILVALEFRDGRLSSAGVVETDDSRSSRSAAVLVLNFSLLDLANRCEQLDEVFIARRPW